MTLEEEIPSMPSKTILHIIYHTIHIRINKSFFVGMGLLCMSKCLLKTNLFTTTHKFRETKFNELVKLIQRKASNPTQMNLNIKEN